LYDRYNLLILVVTQCELW